MIIQCTKKLADELKIKVEKTDLTNENQLFCWHAHLFKIGRTKCVMVMNNESRYHFVIYGLLKKDFAHLDEIIKKEIIANFFRDEFTTDQVNYYLNQIGETKYCATNNRSIISQINDSILITQDIFYEASKSGETIYLYDLNGELNFIPMSKLNGYPIDMMKLLINNKLTQIIS